MHLGQSGTSSNILVSLDNFSTQFSADSDLNTDIILFPMETQAYVEEYCLHAQNILWIDFQNSLFLIFYN